MYLSGYSSTFGRAPNDRNKDVAIILLKKNKKRATVFGTVNELLFSSSAVKGLPKCPKRGVDASKFFTRVELLREGIANCSIY